MDCIEIVIPSNPKYLQLLRLSVSSVGNIMGFDIDDIEDLKVIITEMATFLLPFKDMIKLNFEISEDKLNIIFCAKDVNFESNIEKEGFELKKQILTVLTDKIETVDASIKITKKVNYEWTTFYKRIKFKK